MTVCRISLLMKTWGKIRAKEFVSSESESDAVTPIIGSLLMLIVLVALAGVAVISFSNIANEGESTQPLVARISLESCEGGLYDVDSKDEKITRLVENRIVLVHEGGNSLPCNTIAIKISGYGNSYKGIVAKGGTSIKGNTEVLYQNIDSKEKNGTYMDRNGAVINDGSWNVGEKLVLCGQDSANGTAKSSVKVSVDGDSNTSDNYGFKAGSEVTLKVIDIKSNNVIAEYQAVVKQA